MRFLATLESQMSVEICFPCVLFMTLRTWEMGVDICCRCPPRERTICTPTTRKPVLCGVTQKRSGMSSSSWTPFISKESFLSAYSYPTCRKRNRYSTTAWSCNDYKLSTIKVSVTKMPEHCFKKLLILQMFVSSILKTELKLAGMCSTYIHLKN